jgi:pimeloyl-ACP methyl ester carboxylesterase
MNESHFGVNPLSVSVPGARLAVWEHGAGVPVLFVHGGTGTAAHDWGHLFGRVAQQARAVAWDLRGHGTSLDAALHLGVARFGLDVAHVMQALGIPKAVLVGFSVGANSVLHLAARRPWLVHAIVAIGASAKGDPSRVQQIMSGPWPSELRNLEHTAADNDPAHWERLRGALAHDWADHVDFLSTGLGAVTMPTTIVHGANDPIVLPEQADQLASALPHARLAMIPNAGHQVHREEPEAFMEILQDVLRATIESGRA